VHFIPELNRVHFGKQIWAFHLETPAAAHAAAQTPTKRRKHAKLLQNGLHQQSDQGTNARCGISCTPPLANVTGDAPEPCDSEIARKNRVQSISTHPSAPSSKKIRKRNVLERLFPFKSLRLPRIQHGLKCPCDRYPLLKIEKLIYMCLHP